MMLALSEAKWSLKSLGLVESLSASVSKHCLDGWINTCTYQWTVIYIYIYKQLDIMNSSLDSFNELKYWFTQFTSVSESSTTQSKTAILCSYPNNSRDMDPMSFTTTTFLYSL